MGSTGEQYTDISLSTSYDQSSLDNQVWVNGEYGSGGEFPHPPSATRPNQPGFTFDFSVNQADITSTASIFFNLVFGDYDVIPAGVDFTKINGDTFTANVTTHNSERDGLVQAAFVTLSFNDVFKLNDAGQYDGFLAVDFNAANEPYTAFDFVELSLDPIDIVIPISGTQGESEEPAAPVEPQTPVETVAIPVPSPALLMLFGLAWLGYRKS